MKLTADEVNALIEKCYYGGEYTGIGKRLKRNTPKRLHLNIYEKDLLANWLEDDTVLINEQKSIKNKLLDEEGNYR